MTGHDDRMRYVVTGGTGFIGRRAVSRLLQQHPDAQVWVLVRRGALGRFERLVAGWDDRVKPLVGDLTAENLGLTDTVIAELGGIDHVLHCAAIYDVTAGAAEQQAANVEGTRAVIGLARRLGATLSHVSSIAVAGDFAGEFTEADFDIGQQLPTRYHQTKFEAEALVRSAPGLRYRVYRPAVVVGDSRTGEMDKVDGPYYFFPLLAKLAALPRLTPMAVPDTGRTNIVPVDYVVDALVELMHKDGYDGRTFHLTASKSVGLPEIYRAVAREAGLPPLRATLPGAVAAPVLNVGGRARVWRNMVATQLGLPGEILDLVNLRPTFIADETRAALGESVRLPDFADYASRLWRYWATHLDPDRARRDDPAGPLVGRHVVITGASSGIGRAAAIAVAARGGVVFALARNGAALDALVAEIRADGGQAHAFSCDVTDSASVEHTVKDILGRFGHVDYVSSAAVLARSPRYSAYVPIMAALDAFGDVLSSEMLSDHVTFTTIHMPLVATPMITPSRRLNPMPAISAEHAAAMVVRALVDKPARIDTPSGTLGEVGTYFAPMLARRFLHQLYLGYPDSAAARGVADGNTVPRPFQPRRSKRPARAAAGLRALRPAGGSVRRAVRLVPGLHW